MTAFVSIQLVLLFVFMVAVSAGPDLPTDTTDDPHVLHFTPMAGANREDAIIVSVQRDGRLWLGYRELTYVELPSEIQKALANGSERRVYIHADKHANYGNVLKLLSAVRSAGVKKVSFFVYERKSLARLP
jgi:biopolymer transport protein ExbD